MRQWMCAAAGMLAAVFAAAQTPADECRVEGTVRNSLTGQPVRKAQMRLVPSGGGEPILGATDSEGKYSLTKVSPGIYQLLASHEGYLAQHYGARKPGEQEKGAPLELTAGSVQSETDLSLTPLGTLLGHVRDEDGDPIRQVDVAVLAYGYGPSGKSLQVRSEMQTDAKGEYRLYDLPPGTYYLRAKPSAPMPGLEQLSEAYATVYYPNAAQQAGASAIELAAGQEQHDVDFVLRGVTVTFIRGRVITPPGGENCAATLGEGADELASDDSGGMLFGTVGVVEAAPGADLSFEEMFPGGRKVDSDGKFEFRRVPVGNHAITASCMVGKQRFVAKLPVALEAAGMENVELRPAGPSTINGHVRREGESQTPVTKAQVWLSEAGPEVFLMGSGPDPNAADGKVSEEGAFDFHNLTPGIYHLNVATPKGWYLKSILSDGRDVSESGVDLQAGGMSAELEIVLSANGGSIDGTVEKGDGAQVTLVPDDPKSVRRQAQMVRADAQGHFTFPTVAPGKYKVFAWDTVDPIAAMYDAEFRKPFESQGQAVEVEEKQKATVQLQVIPAVEK